MSRYWQDYESGEEYTSYGRQMTEADIRFLIACAGGSHPLHTDPIYCASRPDIGKPIMPGSMILGWLDATFNDHVCPYIDVCHIPNGYEKIRFIRPVYENDVLTNKIVIDGKEDFDEDFGRVLVSMTISNQDETVVLFAKEAFLIEKRKG